MATDLATAALAARIDALLPQTQCTKCGYAGCAPYAEALAQSAAGINRCPPGGMRLVRRLATLLAREVVPLDPACGVARSRHVARIDEPRCIGCTLCIQACPVDAIVGAPGQMHTAVVELCTGCDLCVAPCPVDCIAMTPAGGSDVRWTPTRKRAARERFERRNLRLASERAETAARRAARRPGNAGTALTAAQKRAAIKAAVARVRARRAAMRGSSS